MSLIIIGPRAYTRYSRQQLSRGRVRPPFMCLFSAR